MKKFFITMAVLALVHTFVSFAAYSFFAQETIESARNLPPVETTTAEQRARGETAIALQHIEVVRRVMPMPVVFYIWFGYAGLAVAMLYSLYLRFRHGQ